MYKDNYRITTFRWSDNGSNLGEEYTCQTYTGDLDHGIISFYTEDGKRHLISMHKMDHIVISGIENVQD